MVYIHIHFLDYSYAKHLLSRTTSLIASDFFFHLLSTNTLCCIREIVIFICNPTACMYTWTHTHTQKLPTVSGILSSNGQIRHCLKTVSTLPTNLLPFHILLFDSTGWFMLTYVNYSASRLLLLFSVIENKGSAADCIFTHFIGIFVLSKSIS